MKRVVVVGFNLVMLFLAVGAELTHSVGAHVAGDDVNAVAPKGEMNASRSYSTLLNAQNFTPLSSSQTYTQIIGNAPGMDEYRNYAQDFGWAHTFDPSGKTVLSASLEIRAWDVDNNGSDPYWEHDIIYVDGSNVGELTGANVVWSNTTFSVDSALLSDGVLNVWIDIDSTYPHPPAAWAVTVDWSQLTVVYELLPVHDVAVTSVSASPTSVLRGQSVTVTVDVKNEGTFSETFGVTAYGNSTVIGAEIVSDLAAGATQTVYLYWDTEGVAEGGHTISAVAGTVLGETDTADNTYTDGMVFVNIDWWPMFHHDLTHRGYSTSRAPDTNKILWTYATVGAVTSSPAVADGKVYVGSVDGKVYALNASSGAYIWSYTTGNQVWSSPAVADGKVYVGSDDSKVYALNASTGAFVWSYQTGYLVRSPPTVADGKVYVNSWDGNVYALNATNGALIWSNTAGGSTSSPAVADGKVYVGSNDWYLYALNATTGALIWKYLMWGGGVDSSPAVADGRVYVGSWNQNLYALNASNGALIWSYAPGGQVYSSPAVADGRVYAGILDGRNVFALNASNGALIWSYWTGELVYSSPAVADGKVYVGSNNGNVYALNASTGAFVWSYQTGMSVGSSPAVADGKVYIGSADGKVYAFAPRQSSITVSLSSNSITYSQNVTISSQLSPPLSDGTTTLQYSTDGTNWNNITSGTQSNGAFSSSWTPTQPGNYYIRATWSGNVNYLGSTSPSQVLIVNQAPTSITSPLISPANSIKFGEGVFITGTVNVTINDGTMTLQNSTDGATWTDLLSMTPVAGSYSFTWTPPAIGTYYFRVSWSGDINYIGCTSTSQQLTVGPPDAADWWPMYSHDLTHTSYSTSTAPETNQILWNTSVSGHVEIASPAVVDGKVYIGTVVWSPAIAQVLALDASTGAIIWAFNMPSYLQSGMHSTPAVADGVVYVDVASYGFSGIYALNATTGALIWSYDTGSSGWSSPAVAYGKVYVGSMDGKVYALNAATGAFVWSYQTGMSVGSSPAVADGKVYVGSEDGNVYALNASTGAYIWSYPIGLYTDSSPAVADGKVYIGSWGGNIYALDATTGAFIWSYPYGGSLRGSPAVAYGKVYIAGNFGKSLHALNATTGALIWSTPSNYASAESTPAVADGKVYIGADLSGFYALNATTGALIWSYQSWWGDGFLASPAVADGKVYIGSGGYKVWAFGLSHDVAVTSVKPSKTMSGQGCSISINVTVTNQGSYTETFNVTVYGNATYIASQNVTLSSGSSATITFTWNRPGFVNGTCAVSAYAWPVPGETNTADNSLVITPGDVNADGRVDILDLSGLSAHWTGPPNGPLGYDLNFDPNCDGNIDILDVAIVSAYWTGPPKGPLAP